MLSFVFLVRTYCGLGANVSGMNYTRLVFIWLRDATDGTSTDLIYDSIAQKSFGVSKTNSPLIRQR